MQVLTSDDPFGDTSASATSSRDQEKDALQKFFKMLALISKVLLELV